MLLGRIKEAMQTRPKVAENSHVLLASTIINCEGWVKTTEDSRKDIEFADNCIAELYRQSLLRTSI